MGLTRRHVAAAALTLAVGCGPKSDGPTQPSPPPASAPTISCPADLSIREVRTSVQPVNFVLPTPTGGAAPVTVTCRPTPGSDFPIGTTPVTCSATDAQARVAACSFNVTLTGFALSATKFTTVGDSLTEGENGRLTFLDLPNAYPTRLQMALDATYPGQNIRVINRGVSGWPIERTVLELPGDLAADRPDAVLLLSGYNDLLNECGRGPVDTPACQAALETIRFGVRDVIRRSKDSNVSYVFVGTLTPPGPVLPGAPRDRRISSEAIIEANKRIRQMTAAEGATVVDLYPLFLGHEPEYVEADGLHLRPAGNQAMADAFLRAIQSTVRQTPLLNRR